jgi:hypothetical protein
MSTDGIIHNDVDQAAEILSWSDLRNLRILAFESSPNTISENIQYKLVVNFLNFSVITHVLKYDKQRRSYDRWNTMHK